MYEEIFNEIKIALKEAMDEVYAIYEKGFAVEYKEDDSPVTTADLRSNAIIRSHLSKFSDIAWLGEEDADNKERLAKDMVFIVDPLDGTQDFVNHDDCFGINIALVKDHKPIMAFIGMPFYGSYCYAVKGQGAYYVSKIGKEERLHVSSRTKDLIYLASKTHESQREKDVVAKHQDMIKEVIHQGASIKAYYLACGKGDCSVRYTSMTKEWDTCAPDLIVKEAGGIFVDSNGKEIVYNREDVYNRDGYSMFNCSDNMFLLR
ncbi:MAG: 3'(2'),5'-bisphosphate nucleotidase CysQ [Bacilli bacterium]